MNRVLIVDDEQDIRFMARLNLEQHGWTVDEAASGPEALERCEVQRYEALVLDMRMPRMTGMEMARELRARGDETPIVLFSAFLEPEIEQRARAAGFVPVPKDDLRGLHDALPDISPTD